MKYVLKASPRTKARLDFASDLNPEQRAVVEADPQPLLVIAGAGSGKTRTLTYRVARLVASGCPPSRIVLTTFTNRAAREMIARVQKILAIDMRPCAAGTFHHVGNRLLRRYGDLVGIAPDFGILDPEDCRDLMGALLSELGLDKLRSRRFPAAKVICSMISMATGTQRSLEDVVRKRYDKFVDQTATLVGLARSYEERKRKLNVVDFDDLLAAWHRLVTETPAHRRDEVLGRFDHVLVDEYQDTNRLQGAIADAMAVQHRSLTCVGDDAQSIYDFRGADVEQMLNFRRRHPDAKLLTLTQNYRSTPEILALANRSIAHNKDQHQKSLAATRRTGPKPAVLALRDVYQQAEFVAQRVLELHHEHGLPLRDMAALYRSHAHSLELQVELTRRNIPFAVRSGTRFFEQAHIKDVIAFLRARNNPRDELAWSRMLRLWPGVGTQTAARLAQRLADEQKPVPARNAFAETARSGQPRARESMQRLSSLWASLDEASRVGPGEEIRLILEQHYVEYAERNFPNASARREDIENLARFASRYDTGLDLLSELALLEGMVGETVGPGADPDDKLVLSTIHQAKGLEWSQCFVLWLANGRFPTPRSQRNAKDMEEERRLFYVAATRAGDELYLCYPTLDEGHDGPVRLMRPSPFLAEIDHAPDVFERWDIEEAPA